MRSLGFLMLCVLATLLLDAGLARAVQIKAMAGLSSDIVEVGEPVNVTLALELDEDVDPSSPELKVPASMQLSRPSTSTFKMQVNWSFKKTYTARWVIVPGEVGTFKLPSPSVIVDGKVVTATEVLSLRVVEKGKGPPASSQPSRRPFGGMGSFFGPSMPFDLDDPFFDTHDDQPLTPRGKDLALEEGLADHLFLYIHADKKTVVIGEQVTLSFYYYADVQAESVTDTVDPPLSQFLRYTIEEWGQVKTPSIVTQVGGRRFVARKFMELAVFPLRAGRLGTGKSAGTFEQRRGLRIVRTPRESNEVFIDVREPTNEGRPLGYVLGSVGRFKLSAEVAPRETTVGEALIVTARVTGLGALPGELRLPSRLGIEWLAPERKEDITVHEGRIGGSRTFDYAVRFSQPGEVDLGSIELPYYDPDKQAYDVATVELGKVRVKPGQGATPAPSASAPLAPGPGGDEVDPFAGLAAPRSTLSEYTEDPDTGVAPRTLWTLVVLPPLGVVLTSVLARVLFAMRARRRARRDDPAVLAEKALADLEGDPDPKDAAAVAERALHLALGAATGLKTRGMLAAELEIKLADVGPLGVEVLELLSLCSTVRFNPDSPLEVERIHRDTKRIVRALLALPPRPVAPARPLRQSDMAIEKPAR